MAMAICRVSKIKSFDQAKAAGGHMSRSRDTPNADPGRQNELLIGTSDPARDLQDRIEQSGVKVNKRSVIGLDLLLTASPEFFRPDDPSRGGHWREDRANEFRDHALAWAKSYFGDENVVSATYHLDEDTPHLTLMLAPIDETPRKKGPQRRLNAARWVDGKKRLSAMQDSFAEAVEELGIERGLRGSTAKHTTVRQYYGELQRNAETQQKMPAPIVETPPLSLSRKNRDDWAASETIRLKELQGPVVGNMVRTATQARVAERKRREAEATAKKKHKEAERLREQADRLRDLSLASVATELGLEQDQQYKSRWHGPGFAITMSGIRWYDHYAEHGGGGAIDLVMHAQGCDFKQAVSWLSHTFSAGEAERAVRASASDVVREAQTARTPFQRPQPSEGDWEAVRGYLTAHRGISAETVDMLHDQGVIYANRRKSHVNLVMLGGRGDDVHAELRGIELDSNYRGSAPGSSRDRGGLRLVRGTPQTLVLVESGVDAMSFYDLHPDGNYLVMSTCGARSAAQFIEDAVASGWSVVCAYDADQVGDARAHEMQQRWPAVERLRPQIGKDWNDELIQGLDTSCGEAKDDLDTGPRLA